MANAFTELSTHDLWVAARLFDLKIKRSSPTTIELTIRRPIGENSRAVDGAVLVLGTKPQSPAGYPVDGTAYVANPVYGAPDAQILNGMQVVGFWSQILGQAWPTGTPSVDNKTNEYTVTISGTAPNTIYYASIHAATNVLQYFPIGIQSYPLEASRIEKDSSTYAGSIPSLPSAPTSPTPGMVYHDEQLNVVQYWDATRSIWIPTRSDIILSGDQNPGVLGQTLMVRNVPRIFDGAAWVTLDSTNLQVRQGTTWAPMGTFSANTVLPTTPALADVFYDYTTSRVQYWDGAVWQIANPSNTLFNSTQYGLTPAFVGTFSIEGIDLVTPYIGLLFYNTRQKQLNVWNGISWEHANTNQAGTTISDKIGIGNDGSYDERLRLINILKAQLGYPVQCVELTEEHFNIAIDNALDTYRQLSIGGYEQRFFTFSLIRDQSIYHLNSPVDRTDAIVQVMKVHRLNLFGVTGSGPDNTWGQAFAQQFYNYAGAGGDLLSTHLVHSWSEEFTRIFAGDIPFTWNEARRELRLSRMIRNNERVVLEVELERTEQELLIDRWCKQFIQGWAMAEVKEILGLIRSKYTSGSPGPAGTINLNGETLLSEARQDFADLKQSLLDYEYNNAEHGGLSFLFA